MNFASEEAFLIEYRIQNRLGELMYAGSNGLTRNIQAAVEYFRLGAAQHDPSSHFGYGLALLNVSANKLEDIFRIILFVTLGTRYKTKRY